MDIVTYAKNLATLLGTASALAYVSGYLAMRARANAFGTDPTFTLVDEAYIFAGIRFLFVTLVILLVSAPVILAIRGTVGWIARQVPEAMPYLEWILLLLLAIGTIAMLRVITITGVLLHQPLFGPDASAWHTAVIGGETYLGLISTFSIVILAALTGLWLNTRIANIDGSFAWILGVVFALQLFMLPIYHGMFYADRKVRVLSEVPDSVSRIVAPVGIIDRTSDHSTLMGLSLHGKPYLVTVKLDDLNGVAVSRVESLSVFLKSTLTQPAVTRNVNGPPASGGGGSQPGTRNTEDLLVGNEPEEKSGFFEAIAEQLKITLEAIGSLGKDEVDAGELWVVDLDGSGSASNARKVDTNRDLSWPVVATNKSTFYAIDAGSIVRLSEDNSIAVTLEATLHWEKLLGVAQDGTVLGLVRLDGVTKPAAVTAGGELRMSEEPLTDEEQRWIAILMQDARVYQGDRKMSVDRASRGRGFDVFLETNGNVVNLSDCRDDSCGQGSLASDFQLAVFVRKSRY
ncbi:MAG: hypothetical protein O7F71_12950 [Gammaproteobacteria bacterium]|nr:hypothetical protein [Gammaproteobacteria bacterium]